MIRATLLLWVLLALMIAPAFAQIRAGLGAASGVVRAHLSVGRMTEHALLEVLNGANRRLAQPNALNGDFAARAASRDGLMLRRSTASR